MKLRSSGGETEKSESKWKRLYSRLLNGLFILVLAWMTMGCTVLTVSSKAQRRAQQIPESPPLTTIPDTSRASMLLWSAQAISLYGQCRLDKSELKALLKPY